MTSKAIQNGPDEQMIMCQFEPHKNKTPTISDEGFCFTGGPTWT